MWIDEDLVQRHMTQMELFVYTMKGQVDLLMWFFKAVVGAAVAGGVGFIIKLIKAKV